MNEFEFYYMLKASNRLAAYVYMHPKDWIVFKKRMQAKLMVKRLKNV